MKHLLPLLLAPLSLLAGDYPTLGTIERLDPALDSLLPPGTKIERLCEGFTWAEGPVWKDGALLFSDVPENIIYRWLPGTKKAAIFLSPSGMLHPRPGFRESGSNGLTLDPAGHLILCEHGERRVARLEPDLHQTALVDHFEGKRFNSPNDLTFRRAGDFYFTDPPYGFDELDASPLKELPFHGVFHVGADGQAVAVIKDIRFPNGIAFSPDEKTLYVGSTDSETPRIMAYDVQSDGTLTRPRLFFDARPLSRRGLDGACDGMKVDAAGNLFASGPGGILVLSPAGKHLGTIRTGSLIANCAWGDDGSMLYLAAEHTLCRVQTGTRGAPWPLAQP
jgi:gluconolactonase